MLTFVASGCADSNETSVACIRVQGTCKIENERVSLTLVKLVRAGLQAVWDLLGRRDKRGATVLGIYGRGEQRDVCGIFLLPRDLPPLSLSLFHTHTHIQYIEYGLYGQPIG